MVSFSVKLIISTAFVEQHDCCEFYRIRSIVAGVFHFGRPSSTRQFSLWQIEVLRQSVLLLCGFENIPIQVLVKQGISQLHFMVRTSLLLIFPFPPSFGKFLKMFLKHLNVFNFKNNSQKNPSKYIQLFFF